MTTVTTALIGNISRYSHDDGPGIRTTIFFKGCPMGCIWCHNPEMQDKEPELSFGEQLCIGCGDCAASCPTGAIVVENTCRIDNTLCNHCMACVDSCPAQALKKVGSEYSAEELLEIVERDSHFYAVSGGGVTLSGGEPTGQLDFILQFTKQLQKRNIHTAIETCGHFDWNETIEELFHSLNLIYFDMKVADEEEHIHLTGCSNVTIIENLRRLLILNRNKVIVSIPLIPQCTASTKNIRRIAEILKSINVMKIRLLPYHPYGQQSSNPVTKKSRLEVLPKNSMNQKELLEWKTLFEEYNFTFSD